MNTERYQRLKIQNPDWLKCTLPHFRLMGARSYLDSSVPEPPGILQEFEFFVDFENLGQVIFFEVLNDAIFLSTPIKRQREIL